MKEKECKELEIDRDRWKYISNSGVENQMASMKQTKTAQHFKSKSKSGMASMKRVVEETKEEFDSKLREKRRVEESKLTKQRHRHMMRRTLSQACKMHRAS